MPEDKQKQKMGPISDKEIFEIEKEGVPFDRGASGEELIKAIDRAVKENIFAPECPNKNDD